MDVPEDLRSDTPRLASQQISMIEVVRRQIDRISYLRSIGAPWGKALMQLRDQLVGLEDKQFWDGMPPKIRQQVEQLEAEGKKRDAKRVKEYWWRYGWLGVPVRAIPGPGGAPKFRPTEDNLSDMQQILMSLLDRRRLLWKTRGHSALPPMNGSAEVEAEAEAEVVVE